MNHFLAIFVRVPIFDGALERAEREKTSILKKLNSDFESILKHSAMNDDTLILHNMKAVFLSVLACDQPNVFPS